MIKLFVLCLLALSIKSFPSCEECALDLANSDNSGIVCGRDGRTYLSECFAKCADTKVEHEGRCARHNCPQLYYPVCTRSGRTYMNECEANFYNEAVIAPGSCRRLNFSNLGGY